MSENTLRFTRSANVKGIPKAYSEKLMQDIFYEKFINFVLEMRAIQIDDFIEFVEISKTMVTPIIYVDTITQVFNKSLFINNFEDNVQYYQIPNISKDEVEYSTIFLVDQKEEIYSHKINEMKIDENDIMQLNFEITRKPTKIYSFKILMNHT